MAKVIVSTEQIAEALLDSTSKSRYLRKAVEKTIEDGAKLWKIVWETSLEGVEGKKALETGETHPYETGNYVEHIKTEKLAVLDRFLIKRALKNGGLMGKIYNDADDAVFIEKGTAPDKEGSRSPWGPNTPTPEFRVAERTAALMREGFTG